MKQYLDLVQHVLDNGIEKSDRTGTGTLSVFGYQMRHDLSKGFPILTTKKIHLKSVIYELLWFLKGDTNVKYLNDNGVTIWNEWADPVTGSIGPGYGRQWRRWQGRYGIEIDQITTLIHQIITNPDSRRLIVSAWNVAELPYMALPPCHVLFQFYVANGKLSCCLFQRSVDVGLGLGFNQSSYSLLTMMIAQVCGLRAGELVHSMGDVHIYRSHVDALREQLTREPRPLPRMKINPAVKDIFEFKYEDFTLEGYDPHPSIRMEVAV